ncbi:MULTISPECIES: aldo/keto reductase [unclassified Beijerinckia]|uniref:aldo/keto reductase n=1 Tax=unclassified Beijerinckia TaxID=2638183 RepID=UPI00089A3A14|nr:MULTISPECIES: aldo/keto reductase [unclassified Beijerinckia]MDH7794987.1 aryl-alcohol dehydrogenase-like predicted oxidoreductase [Beijerinckia sp. GAS462]SEB82983.1 Predicted oxidoreductase [Beijerinckia sp. 28-YEA-48]
MEFRTVGRSGLRVSTLGIGCNNFGGRLDEENSRKVIHAALDAGVNFFDTADVYPMNRSGASEEILGRALGSRRADTVIATKFGLPLDRSSHDSNGSRRYMIAAVEASLKRLGTDWIDLYQLHFPDHVTPIEETLRGLDDLVRQGKVRYIGMSNMPTWQLVDALHASDKLNAERFISSQNQYSLLARDVEAELLPALEHHGLGLLPFFPLASGFLSGKYRRNVPLPEGRLTKSEMLADIFLRDNNYEIVERLDEFCTARGITMLQLAFRWLLSRRVVPSVIAGASTPEQVQQNADAVSGFLSGDDVAEIERLAGNAPSVFWVH